MKKCKWLSMNFVKYTVSALVSTLVEIVVFLLCAWLLQGAASGFVVDFLPMAVARVVSCLQQFFTNRKWVFKSSQPTGPALLRYFLQVVLTSGGYELFQITGEQVILRGVVYTVVMMTLFVVGYLAQKFWVFPVAEKEARGDGK